MIIKFGKNVLDINIEALEFLNDGKESNVYKYKNMVLKIHKKYSEKDTLSEEDAKRIIGLDTMRMLLTRDLIYSDEDQYIGKTAFYVPQYSNSIISNYKMMDFLSDLDLLRDDCLLLAKNNISIWDLDNNNMLLSKYLFVCDDGSYRYEHSQTKKEVSDFNIYQYNNFVIEELLRTELMKNNSKAKTNRILGNVTSHINGPLKYMESTMKPDEHFGQYVKRMGR